MILWYSGRMNGKLPSKNSWKWISRKEKMMKWVFLTLAKDHDWKSNLNMASQTRLKETVKSAVIRVETYVNFKDFRSKNQARPYTPFLKKKILENPPFYHVSSDLPYPCKKGVENFSRKITGVTVKMHSPKIVLPSNYLPGNKNSPVFFSQETITPRSIYLLVKYRSLQEVWTPL